jgi:sugar phosphate isomerase/epimerase
MKGHVMRNGWIVVLMVMLAALGGCASKGPQWKTGVSWKDLSYESLKELRAAGIESIEVTVADVMKTPVAQRAEKCRQIVADAQKAGILLWSGHIPFGRTWDISTADAKQREQVLGKVREAMEVCAMLKLKKAVIHASAEPIKDDERQTRLAICKDSLRTLTPEFAQRQVQLALEDLPRTCLGNTSEEILWLIQGIDGLGVCFDTNHLLKEKPEDFVRKVGQHIVTLHVSDYDGVDERHWMAGEGIVNWKAVTGALREANYNGPLLFETSKHKDGTVLKAVEMVAFVRKV